MNIQKPFKIKIIYISSYQVPKKQIYDQFQLNSLKSQTKYQYFYGHIQSLGNSLRNFQINQSVIVFLPFNHENTFDPTEQTLSVIDKYMIQIEVITQISLTKIYILICVPYRMYFPYITDYSDKPSTTATNRQKINKFQFQVLILNPYKTGGQIATQMIKNSFVVAKNNQELIHIQKITKNQLYVESEQVWETIQDENMGMGVDIILDFNTTHQNTDIKNILNMLSFNGQWVIFNNDQIQLDPPDMQVLIMKSASLHMNFIDGMLACGFEQGKVLHIFDDFLKNEKISFYCEKVCKYQDYDSLDAKYKNDYFVLQI